MSQVAFCYHNRDGQKDEKRCNKNNESLVNRNIIVPRLHLNVQGAVLRVFDHYNFMSR